MEEEDSEDPPLFENSSALVPGLNSSSAEDERHQNLMQAALRLAEMALASNEVPVGCVFVYNNQIIAKGMNDTNRSLNGTRHAELIGINSILRRYSTNIFDQVDLYVTVEPCIMCAAALRQFGIRAVYFGCSNDKFGGAGGVLTINTDLAIDRSYPAYGGLFREEAIMLLRRFYLQENRKAPEPHSRNRQLKTETDLMQ